MNRRDFIKLMAATPLAAPAVSTAEKLLSLPEVKPKIQLLEPKIIVPDVLEFDYVVSWSLHVRHTLSSPSLCHLNTFTELNATVHVANLEGTPIICNGDQKSSLTYDAPFTAKLNVPELSDKLFLVKSILVSALYDHVLSADIEAIQMET